MKKHNNLIVRFGGLREGIYNFDYELDKKFFDDYDIDFINDANLKVDLNLDKKTTFMTLIFNIEGFIIVDCDRCNDDLKMNIITERKIYIKFADDYGEESDDVLLIPHAEIDFNISQLCYEFIALEIPIKKVHDIEDCNQEVIEKLNNLLPGSNISDSKDDEDDIDPRWNALKNLN